MELVTTLELSHGSGTVVDHQLEAYRARDFNKSRRILLLLVPAFSTDMCRRLVVTIIIIIISSGHLYLHLA